MSFFTALIGLIISAVALSKSRKAGFKNTPALVGIIIGASSGHHRGVVIAIIVSITVVSERLGREVRRARPGRPHGEGGIIT